MQRTTKAPESPVVVNIRKKALQRGGKNGIRSIGASLRIMDDNGDFTLSPEEFRGGLRDWGIAITDEDFAEVLKTFDRNGDGRVDVNEFIRGIRGPMSSRRVTVVNAAFKKIDQNGNGVVDINDIASFYDVSRHPEVLSGKRTAAEVMLQFMCLFDDQTNPDGKVTYNEFVDYYAGVSASIDNDMHFELLLTRAWALDRPRNYKPGEAVEVGMTATGQKTSTFGRDHPLYQTSASHCGKGCVNVPVDKSHNRSGVFTNKAPPPQPYSGLTTSSTKTKV